MKKRKHKPKKLYDTETLEKHSEARIIGGNPDGEIDFNDTPHDWAVTIYQNMVRRTWFTSQIPLTDDIVAYTNSLTDRERFMYDLTLAQLIPNDSIQSNQLADRINSYVTSPVVNACLIRQAAEEVLHSEQYSVLASDVVKDSKRISNLKRTDTELMLKNKSVADMYESLYGGDEPTDDDLMMVFAANQILEELVFPGGFVAMYSLEKKMPGSAQAIAEINKDESLSHVPLFKNIFRAAIAEEYDKIVPPHLVKRITDLIMKMTESEIRWLNYLTKGVFGFSEVINRNFIESQANNVCANLRIPYIYENHKENPLAKVLQSHLKGGNITSRGAFFEVNVVEYSKGALIIDF